MKFRQAHPFRDYEWMRADPDYDDPLPSMWSMVPAAIVVVIVGLIALGFALAVLAPEVH